MLNLDFVKLIANSYWPLLAFKIADITHSLDMYADDVTIYMDGSTESLRAVLDALSDFYEVCGLKINLKKCTAVWIGNKANSLQTLCPEVRLDWQNSFKLLGLFFKADLTGMDENFTIKLEEIKVIFNSWFNRFLTPHGKVLIIKSLVLSKLSHIVTIIPSLSNPQLKLLTKTCFKFIWNNKPDMISREAAVRQT